LAAQQRNLESLVDHIPLGTLLYDADFKLLVVNPMGQEILATLEEGQSAESAPLNTLRLTELVSQTARALLNGETQPLATIEISQAGPPLRTFALLVSPVGDEARQWVVTIRETTQEREAQARIQSQERLAVVGQLAAGIAHDFNNIMAAILVYADLLLSDPHLPRASADKLTIIQQQVQRAASLIRQILDFSRRSVMEQSPLDLLPFIKELDKLLARVLPETIRLDLVYQPVEYWVNADPTRLQQVFMNLALNARDAMPNGGRLRFELSRFTQVAGQPPPLPDLSPGEWVRIIVSDTGPGIPPEARAHIFEPFFTTKPIGRGTGLGLAQVYGIIRQHDGYIDVQSEPGTGATFRIFLPLRRPLVEGNSPGEQIRPLMGRGQQILVVEDDEATRSALRALLEASHFQVTTASNGIEALRLLKQPNTPPFQLVISDLVMPRMGGLALYQAMQAQGMQIKILFITGHPLDEASQDLLEAGRVHWLQKPFSMQTFNQAVRAILGTGPLR
jgi:signal transduction histidine kinase